jgi:hypothetical protein
MMEKLDIPKEKDHGYLYIMKNTKQELKLVKGKYF